MSALYEVKVPLWKLQEYHLFSSGGSLKATFNMGTFVLRIGDTLYEQGGVRVAVSLAEDSTVLVEFYGQKKTSQKWFKTVSTSELVKDVTTMDGKFRQGDLIYLCDENGSITLRAKLQLDSRYVNYDANGQVVGYPTAITASQFFLEFSDPNFSLSNACPPSSVHLFPGALFEPDPPLTNWIVRAGDKTYHTHRNVLKAASDFFPGMFEAHMQEGRTGEMDIPGFPVESVEAFLSLIYKPAGIVGYVTEGAAVLFDVYRMAHMYRVTLLVELCKKIFRFIKIDESSLFASFALQTQHDDLESLDQQREAGKATYGDRPQFNEAISEAMTVNPTLAKKVLERAIAAGCVPPGFWDSDGFAAFARADFNAAAQLLGRAGNGDVFKRVMLSILPINKASVSME